MPGEFGAMSGDFGNVVDILPQLLAYGIIGLSAVTLLLAFFLFYRVVSQEQVSRGHAVLSIVFLAGSFVFLIGGAFLERFVSDRPLTIVFNVTPWDESSEEKYGELYIRHGLVKNTMDKNVFPIEVKHESEVGLEIHKLIRKMDELEFNLKAVGDKLAQLQQKYREDIGIDMGGI